MLVVVRHGRTPANAGGLLLGHSDPALDEVGERQAKAVAMALGQVDRVVASPLRRARDTAAALGLPVEVDERWIELHYGTWDGQPVGQVPAEVWAAWRRDVHFRPPGGESLAELGERVRAACDDLLADAAERTVVVVTHVSPVKAATAWALGVADDVTWRMYVAPGSITRIDIRDGDRPVLVAFDETGHLS